MALDTSGLLSGMIDAARGALTDDWPEVRDYAESELRKFTEALTLIERMTAHGSMSPERARLHIDFQKSSMRAVLLTVQGLGVLAVENAINAAIDAVKDTVNTALGFRLL